MHFRDCFYLIFQHCRDRRSNTMYIRSINIFYKLLKHIGIEKNTDVILGAEKIYCCGRLKEFKSV